MEWWCCMSSAQYREKRVVEVPSRRERERERGEASTSSKEHDREACMGRSKQGGGSIGKDHQAPSWSPAWSSSFFCRVPARDLRQAPAREILSSPPSWPRRWLCPCAAAVGIGAATAEPGTCYKTGRAPVDPWQLSTPRVLDPRPFLTTSRSSR